MASFPALLRATLQNLLKAFGSVTSAAVTGRQKARDLDARLRFRVDGRKIDLEAASFDRHVGTQWLRAG